MRHFHWYVHLFQCASCPPLKFNEQSWCIHRYMASQYQINNSLMMSFCDSLSKCQSRVPQCQRKAISQVKCCSNVMQTSLCVQVSNNNSVNVVMCVCNSTAVHCSLTVLNFDNITLWLGVEVSNTQKNKNHSNRPIILKLSWIK